MSTVADLIPSPGEPTPLGLASSTPPVVTPPPSGTPAKRKVGRPKGSKTTRPNSARRAAPKVATAAADAVLGDEAPKGPGRPTKRQTDNERMEEGLRNFYVGTGAMLQTLALVIRNPRASAVGGAMMEQASVCARSLVAWSETNPAVRKALESLTTAGGAALVASAHAPIIMAALNPPSEMGEAGGLGALVSLFGDMFTDDDGNGTPGA